MSSAANFSRGLNLGDRSLALISDAGSVYLIDLGMRFKRLYKFDSGYLLGIHAAHDNEMLIDSLQLEKIAQILPQCLRGTEDLLARYEDKEFIRVLPDADADVVLNRG